MGRLTTLRARVEMLVEMLEGDADQGERGGEEDKERRRERSALRIRARFIAKEVDVAARAVARDLSGVLTRGLYAPLAVAACAIVARIFGTRDTSVEAHDMKTMWMYVYA